MIDKLKYKRLEQSNIIITNIVFKAQLAITEHL